MNHILGLLVDDRLYSHRNSTYIQAFSKLRACENRMEVTITHVEYGEETTTTVDEVKGLTREGEDVTIEWEHGYPSLYEEATIQSVKQD